MAQVIRNGQPSKAAKKPEKKVAAKKAKPAKTAKPKKEAKAKGPSKPRTMSRQLNDKEIKVVGALIKAKGEDVRLEDLATVFDKKGTASRTKGNSWVRNSLRKLLVLKLAKQTGRGSYKALVTKVPPELLGKEAKPEKKAKPRKAKVAKPKEAKADEPNGVAEAPPAEEPAAEAAAE